MKSARNRTADHYDYGKEGETFDKVLGLELGSDDYVVSPSTPRGVARVKAIMRRASKVLGRRKRRQGGRL